MATKRIAAHLCIPEAVRQVEAEIAQTGDLDTYLRCNEILFAGFGMGAGLTHVATIPEYVERFTHDWSQERNTSSVFYRGGMLALRAVSLTQSSPILRQLGAQQLEPPLKGDFTYAERGSDWLARNQVITDKAHAALAELAPQSRYNLHDISMAITDGDWKGALHFNNGFGYTLQVAKEQVERQRDDMFGRFMEHLYNETPDGSLPGA